ncbi:NAD(P)/FAD-dependent oxidoreductase, partial [Candidatus Bathyarchaeota archaeon]|nr:NAD(P)/FAD-dependent oxidoreductase [Candidatus Bathyarchaeota archaeon]
AAEAGLKVALVERKAQNDIGRKICGDALGEHHIKNVGLQDPPEEAIEARIEGIKIYSPDLETVFTVKHEDFSGYLLDRKLFGQWLLEMALDAGATLMDSTLCLEPIIEDKTVTGISAKNLKTNRKLRLKSKVVVDSSGFLAIIRRKLPEEMKIEKEISNEDVEACYREIRQLKEEKQTRYCEIYLDQNITPGGYTWLFYKSGSKVNAGLGVCMKKSFPNPKTQFYKHILSKPVFNGSTIIDAGAWYDPTRRPLDNMVANGVIITGDAACLVNPIHGGGIGPSMISGFLAGKTIAEALEEGDVSQKALWQYNLKYMDSYGGKQAALDVFRLLLITCSNDDLNYGMKYKLLTEEDVLKAGLGEKFHLNITDAARRVFRGLKRLSFLNKLRVTVNLMNKIKEHYKNYPESPDNFEAWKTETERLFQEARLKLL